MNDAGALADAFRLHGVRQQQITNESSGYASSTGADGRLIAVSSVKNAGQAGWTLTKSCDVYQAMGGLRLRHASHEKVEGAVTLSRPNLLPAPGIRHGSRRWKRKDTPAHAR